MKAMILGIDGGSLEILQPMVERGWLPVLGGLMEKGACGHLTSTIPPITGAAWTSFATGSHPGNHGLVDFVAPRPGSYRPRILNSTHRLRPTLWRLMGEAGLSAGIIGVPMTYPPEDQSGYLITGLMTPPGARPFTSPASLAGEIEAELGPFPVHPGEGVMPSQRERYLEKIRADMRQRAAWALHLIRERPTDLFAYVFSAVDPIQHQFYDVIRAGLDGEGSGEPEGLFGDIISIYRLMDDLMGRMIVAAGGDPLILVMSDHGFGPLKGFFHVNTWLVKKGYMRLKKGPASFVQERLFRSGITPENIHLLLMKFGIDLRRRVNKGRSYRSLRRLFLSFDNVDWTRTSAFSMGHVGQIYINRRDRFEQGEVDPGEEFGKVRNKLREDLLSLKNPGTGQPLIDRVFFREELYPGETANPMPDILFLPAGLEVMSFGETEFASSKIVGPALGHTGHHRMEGILIAAGPGVPPGDISGARIMDLAPTILYYLALGIPREMDGRVLEGIFPTGRLAERPPEELAGPTGETASRSGYTEEEEAMIKSRLEDLGYIN